MVIFKTNFEISSPGVRKDLAIGFSDDSLIDGDVIITVVGSASMVTGGLLTIENERPNSSVVEINGVEYEVGRAILFDVEASAGIAPTNKAKLFFAYTTLEGEELTIWKYCRVGDIEVE